MSHKQKLDTSAKETVLLRQAVPKYNFSARKLPKESTEPTGSVPEASPSITSPPEHKGADSKLALSHTPPLNNFPLKADSKRMRPVAVVGASLQSPLTTDSGNGKMDTHPVQPTQTSSAHFQSSQNLTSAARNHDLDKNDEWNISTEGISLNLPVGETHQASTLGNPSSRNTFAAMTKTRNQTSAAHQTFLQRDTLILTSDERIRADECVKNLENERNELKKELDVQLQVNSELKRLLVASVGDDLSRRVERLCRDRAQLSLDLGGFSKKMTEEYENLDKVSIQADMWRSKYLASQVMTEELGNARAFYALQCHDTQDALHQMLNERHELRTNLLEVRRVLQNLKSAFDPLNSQRSLTLRSTNVLDLSRSCQQLAEAMRFRLLPAHVAINADVEIDDSLWADSVTRAEQFAHEVLSRPAEPPGSLQSGSFRLLPLTAPPDSQVTRFHPHTRHENLTYNCCATCKGEINVI